MKTRNQNKMEYLDFDFALESLEFGGAIFNTLISLFFFGFILVWFFLYKFFTK